MPVSFLKTALLGGAALGALPIIIHILSRRRFRVTVWAAMEFLLEAVHQNARRLMIQDILLMLLRVLIIVLLALALARPVLTGSVFGVFAGTSQVGALILLDDSYSMAYRTASGPLFDRARSKVRDIIRSLPAGSMVSILTVDQEATVQVQPTFDLALATELVGELKPSSRRSNLAAGLREAPELLRRMAKPRREVFLVTDAQRGALPGEAKQLSEALAPITELATAYLVRIAPTQPENVALDSLKLRSELPATAGPIDFAAALSNRGHLARSQATVELFSDGVKVDTTEVDLGGSREAGRSQAVLLRAQFERPGLHRLEARLLGDHLEPDDRRYLPLRAYDAVPVLVVDGEPGGTLFEGEADYLAFALSPVDPDSGEVVSAITTKVIRAHELPQEALGRYAAVVLANVAAPPGAVVAALEEYVARGGGVFIFSGDQVDAAAYNRGLYRAGQGLLPGELGEPVGSGVADEDAVGFSAAGLTHPVVSLFADPENVDLTGIRVYRAHTLTFPEGSTGRVLWRYTTGGAALAERSFGRGRVLFLTTTADAEWTNLPHKAAFVPLVHRAVSYLTRTGQEAWNLVPGQSIVIPVGVDRLGAVVEVERPDGRVDEVQPELTDEGPRVLYGETYEPGFYELRWRGRSEPFALYAVNVDTRESELTGYSEAELEQFFAGYPVRILGEEEPLGQAVRQGRRGRELWRWFLAAVVGLAVLETFLGRAFAPKS